MNTPERPKFDSAQHKIDWLESRAQAGDLAARAELEAYKRELKSFLGSPKSIEKTQQRRKEQIAADRAALEAQIEQARAAGATPEELILLKSKKLDLVKKEAAMKGA